MSPIHALSVYAAVLLVTAIIATAATTAAAITVSAVRDHLTAATALAVLIGAAGVPACSVVLASLLAWTDAATSPLTVVTGFVIAGIGLGAGLTYPVVDARRRA